MASLCVRFGPSKALSRAEEIALILLAYFSHPHTGVSDCDVPSDWGNVGVVGVGGTEEMFVSVSACVKATGMEQSS